jgi:hypothetical protein
MKPSNRRDWAYRRRLRGWAARSLFLVILSISVVFLLTALGARTATLGAKFAASCPAACASPSHAKQLSHFVASGQSTTDLDDPADLDMDMDESPSDDVPSDHDDGGGIDEMTVQRWDPIPRPSFCILLWHETPRLSGVIHSPEPRPARRV